MVRRKRVYAGLMLFGLVICGILSVIWWPVDAHARSGLLADHRLYLPYVASESCNPGPALTPDDIERNLAVEARINEIRSENKLPRLTHSKKITQASLRHSNDMADNNFFSHTGSDGSRVGERLERSCYKWMTYGEILSAGLSSPSAVVDSWMKSSDHAKIILNSQFADFGAGYAYSETSTYKHYWTVTFGLLANEQNDIYGAYHNCTYHMKDNGGELSVRLYTTQPCEEYEGLFQD